MVAFALALLAAPAWRRYAAWYQARREMLAAQRACLDYQPPAGQVVYHQPASATLRYSMFKPFPAMNPRPGVAEWLDYHDKYVAPFSAPSGVPRSDVSSMGTLFLHGRRSPGGNERLVAIDIDVVQLPDSTLLLVDKRAIIPGTLRSEPKETWGGPPGKGFLVGQGQQLIRVRRGQEIRLHPGKADPSDPAHFTIEYDVGQRHETVDGWLRDDDSVELKVNNGQDEPRQWEDKQPRGQLIVPAPWPLPPLVWPGR